MRRFRPSAALLLACAALAVVTSAGVTGATFAGQADSTGNRVAAAPDFRAPTASASIVGKSAPYLAGKVKQGGTYHVYANASDTGNPASNIASISADVSTVSAGQTAVALSAGSFSAEGVSYGYRSAALTADGTLAEGTKAFTLTLNDNAANTRTQSGFSVTVDNTAPSASDVQTANGGGNSGEAEAGDTVTYTFSEPVDPDRILAGWTGGATDVVVRIIDNALLFIGLGNDNLVVYNSANTTQLPLGNVDLGRTDYAGALLGGNATFGASGTKSSMTMSGSTITITLGTANSNTVDGTGTGTMQWQPVATPTDAAANAMSTTVRNETGAADREF